MNKTIVSIRFTVERDDEEPFVVQDSATLLLPTDAQHWAENFEKTESYARDLVAKMLRARSIG